MKTKELLIAYASSIESLRRQVVLAQQALTRLEVAEQRTPGAGPLRSDERDLLEEAKEAAELIRLIQEHVLEELEARSPAERIHSAELTLTNVLFDDPRHHERLDAAQKKRST